MSLPRTRNDEHEEREARKAACGENRPESGRARGWLARPRARSHPGARGRASDRGSPRASRRGWKAWSDLLLFPQARAGVDALRPVSMRAGGHVWYKLVVDGGFAAVPIENHVDVSPSIRLPIPACASAAGQAAARCVVACRRSSAARTPPNSRWMSRSNRAREPRRHARRRRENPDPPTASAARRVRRARCLPVRRLDPLPQPTMHSRPSATPAIIHGRSPPGFFLASQGAPMITRGAPPMRPRNAKVGNREAFYIGAETYSGNN